MDPKQQEWIEYACFTKDQYEYNFDVDEIVDVEEVDEVKWDEDANDAEGVDPED